MRPMMAPTMKDRSHRLVDDGGAFLSLDTVGAGVTRLTDRITFEVSGWVVRGVGGALILPICGECWNTLETPVTGGSLMSPSGSPRVVGLQAPAGPLAHQAHPPDNWGNA